MSLKSLVAPDDVPIKDIVDRAMSLASLSPRLSCFGRRGVITGVRGRAVLDAERLLHRLDLDAHHVVAVEVGDEDVLAVLGQNDVVVEHLADLRLALLLEVRQREELDALLVLDAHGDGLAVIAHGDAVGSAR